MLPAVGVYVRRAVPGAHVAGVTPAKKVRANPRAMPPVAMPATRCGEPPRFAISQALPAVLRGVREAVGRQPGGPGGSGVQGLSRSLLFAFQVTR